MTIEASTEGFYADPGAKCDDPVWGDLSKHIKVHGTVELVIPSTYSLTYTCTNLAPWHVSVTKKRTVVVRDTTCPVCTLKGKAHVSVEADFTLTDPGATCTDVISGQLSVDQTGNVNVRQVGDYKITYRAKDMAGNWNDGCGNAGTVRTVSVIDTLKPVIALSSAGQYIHLGKGGDQSSTDINQGSSNPADSYFQKSIVTWDNNQQAGAGPWLMPNAADWANPRNTQASELDCMEQCKKIAACRFGTYMKSGERRGECWLTAHAAPKQSQCAGSCTGFEVKVDMNMRRRLFATTNTRTNQWLALAGGVVGVCVALVIAHQQHSHSHREIEV